MTIQFNTLKLFIYTACIATLFNSSKSFSAAFIIEPGLGYKQEVIKLTDKNTKLITKLSAGAPTASLKLLLYSSTGVSLGLAGEYSKGQVDLEPAVNPKPDFTHMIGSFQLGVSAMDSMKIYLGYAPVNTFETITNSSFTGFKLKGSSYIAGIALYPYHRFGLNVQYNISTYKEITGANYTLGNEPTLYYDKIDSQDLSIIISYLF